MAIDRTELAQLKLYYGNTTDEEIRKVLETMQPVQEHEGKFYFLTRKALADVMTKPRSIAYTFNYPSNLGEEVTDLRERITFPFLVKSSSRFMLKPDTGEVLDQLDLDVLPPYRAFKINMGTQECTNEGEYDEFVMYATLYF